MIGTVSIIIEGENSERVNALLHEYRADIVGRMGLPMKERGIAVISVVMDAPQSSINGLAGKLGRLAGVSAKALYGKAE